MSYTVTINAQTYQVYADVAYGDQYAAERPGSGSTAWLAGTTTTKSQALLVFTRMMERIEWRGTRVAQPPTQVLAWPRAGVVTVDGVAVDAATIPADLSRACVEGAMAVLIDPDGVLTTATGSGSNIKRVSATTGTEVEFWRPVDGQRLPLAAYESMAQYMASSMSLFTAPGVGQDTNIPDGAQTNSLFEDATKFDLTRGL